MEITSFSKELEVESKKGEVIFFPSKLDHYVPENKSCDMRISLAFNCFTFPLTEDSMELGYEKSKYFSFYINNQL